MINTEPRQRGAASRRITIVGTGCIGTSMGLALRKRTALAGAEPVEIVGHDRDVGCARRAQKLGAFDKIAVNLDLALRDAQLIIVAVPLAALHEVFQDIGRLLAPRSERQTTAERQQPAGRQQPADVVITDTAPLKEPALRWAESAFPPGVHYVGGDPFPAPGAGGWEPLAGVTDAREELFEGAVYAITARPQDHPSAVRTVANLALVLGATPLFMDPVEHDAVRLISRTVPALLATALFQATTAAPGWLEVRKAAGREFATATAGAAGDSASQRMAALLGRETVLRGLDAVMTHLGGLRQCIAEGDAEALEAALTAAIAGRRDWRLRSESRAWHTGQPAPEQESLLDRTLQALLGEGAMGKPGGM